MLLIRRRKFACANGDDPRRTSLREHYAPAANAPHPFSILFYVFPPDCAMFMYVRLIIKSEDTRLFVSYARRRQWRSIGVRGSRSNTCFPRASAFSSSIVFFFFPFLPSSHSPFLFLPLSLSFSLPLPHFLLISLRACSFANTHDSPMPRTSFIPGGRLLRLISILETSPLRGLPSRPVAHSLVLAPISSLLLPEPLSPFFACLRITQTHFHPSVVPHSLGISFRHIERK